MISFQYNLPFYIYAFSHLRVDKARGIAPHKPILLLSIIHQFELGNISDRRIYITPELTSSFADFWNSLVETNHTKKFALPFYHLSSEKGNWWKFVPNLGCEIWIENTDSMRSFGNLSVAIDYVELEQNLANFLLEKSSRDILKKVLFENYFPNQKLQIADNQEISYVENLRKEILEELPEAYAINLKAIKDKGDLETYQIEVYNRGTVFRREICQIYNETCCISGLRVDTPFTISMIDACHIVPFKETFNNNPTNGIALCPNLHRAFDRGLISIDENYKVIVSNSFREETSLYGLKQLKNIEIKLPNNHLYLPSQEYLIWHRNNILKK